MPIEFTLDRIINNDSIFYGASNTSAKLHFEKLELWIPKVRLNPILEL